MEENRILDLGLNLFTCRLKHTTFDKKKRQVRAVLSREAPVEVFSFMSFEMIDELILLEGIRFKDQIPLLDSHKRSSVSDQLGSIDNFEIEDKELVADLNFGRTERAEVALSLIEDGHLTDISIGHIPMKREIVDKGATFKTKDGRKFEGPIEIVMETELFEASVLPVGADEFAKIRHASGKNEKKFDSLRKEIDILREKEENLKAVIRVLSS